LELNQNGNNLGWRATVLTADVEGRQLQQLSGSISNTQLGRVMQCGLLFGTSGPPDRFVGNMSLTRDGSLADHAPWHGYVGETAAERILRLCGEEGLTCTIVGEPAATARMGSQRPDTLLGLFRDCELTDGGRFGDGLTYRTRMSMLNQEPVIALGRTDLVESISTEDDRHVRNDVTATGRSSGATGRFVDEASVKAVGRYTDSITVNPEHDHDLQNLASWRAHMGSVDEMRWPAMSISPLRRRPDGSDLVDEWLALRPGDRITARNCFPQLAGLDIDVIVEG